MNEKLNNFIFSIRITYWHCKHAIWKNRATLKHKFWLLNNILKVDLFALKGLGPRDRGLGTSLSFFSSILKKVVPTGFKFDFFFWKNCLNLGPYCSDVSPWAAVEYPSFSRALFTNSSFFGLPDTFTPTDTSHVFSPATVDFFCKQPDAEIVKIK